MQLAVSMANWCEYEKYDQNQNRAGRLPTDFKKPMGAAHMKIGNTIEQLRVQRGWSLDELAERVGITKSSLSRMENDSQWPRPETLESVAAALDVKVYQLFALADAEPLPTTPPSWVRDEEEIVHAYRAMEPDARKQYRELARILADKGRAKG